MQCAQSKGDVLAKAVTYLERVAAERDSLHEVLADLSRLIVQYNALAAQIDPVRQENLLLRCALCTRTRTRTPTPTRTCTEQTASASVSATPLTASCFLSPAFSLASSPCREFCRRLRCLLLATRCIVSSSRSRPGHEPRALMQMQMQMLMLMRMLRQMQLRKARASLATRVSRARALSSPLCSAPRRRRRRCVPEERSAAPALEI